MRILQAVGSLDPIHGGPPTVVLRLSAALARQGATVAIYSTERSGREGEIVRALQGIPGMELVRRISDVCDQPVDRLLGRSAWAFMRKGHSDFDLIHVHGLWSPPLLAVLRAAVRWKRPYVVTPHGMLARWPLEQKPWRKKLAFALAWRRLVRRALFVQALTRAEADDYRALAIDAPVEIVPNGFFPEEMGELPTPGTYLARQPRLAGRRFILFLGRLHYVKRVDLLVRAFARVTKAVPDVDLVLAGPDCGTQPQIERLVKTLALDGRVLLPGPLYGPEKYAAMVDALCFCQTSVYETFSMSILEAMACGTPPVVTRGCNFDEVGTSGSGLVVDDTEETLAAALIHYCAEPGARDTAARKARQLVVEKYTWPIVAGRMLAAYESRLRSA
jgi:glycosyltransferase involved in cell wall biosynthesis